MPGVTLKVLLQLCLGLYKSIQVYKNFRYKLLGSKASISFRYVHKAAYFICTCRTLN